MSKPTSATNPDCQQRKHIILHPPPMFSEGQLMNQQMTSLVPIIPGTMVPMEAPTQDGLPMFSVVPMDNGTNGTLLHSSQVPPGFVSYGYQQPEMGMMLPPGMILMPTTGPVPQQSTPHEGIVLGPRYSAPCAVPVSFLSSGVVIGHQRQSSHPDILHRVEGSFTSNNQHRDSQLTEFMMPEQRRHSISEAGKSAKIVKNPTRYKTEMCRNWVEKGKCRYGSKCQFAHGEAELRQVSRHPRYKTELCKAYHLTGACPYGSRCRFIHALPQPGQSDESIDASLLFKLSDLLGDQQAEALPGFAKELQETQSLDIHPSSIPETEDSNRIRPTSVSAPEQRSIQEEMESLIGAGLLFESGVENDRSQSEATINTSLPQVASMGSYTSTDDTSPQS